MREVKSAVSFIRAVTTDDLPFIRAILDSPRAFTTRLVYADWLQERGEIARAEYLRAWVALSDPALSQQQRTEAGNQLDRLWDQLSPVWMRFVKHWETREEKEKSARGRQMKARRWDRNLRTGPCLICGWSTNVKGVSRMACESCGRVFCWECADTGVHGSLADFWHFVEGNFSHSYRLGRDSCLFCQTSTWMKAHGG